MKCSKSWCIATASDGEKHCAIHRRDLQAVRPVLGRPEREPGSQPYDPPRPFPTPWLDRPHWTEAYR